MAYENDILTRDADDALAVRTVQSVGDNPATNYDDIYTRDNNGKLAVRVVGSGGGDSHNKGYYATQESLEDAYPTAEAGDYAIVGSTDTVWIWDEDSSSWKDTDTKGQVTSVNSKTGAVVLTASDVGALPQVSTMPAASADNAGAIVEYVGTTNANYTNGYVYQVQNVVLPDSISISQTTGADLSNLVVDKQTFLDEAFIEGDPTDITITFTFLANEDDEWERSDSGDPVWIEDYGVTYSGTPVEGDAITVVYSTGGMGYQWAQKNVQPQPTPYEIGATTKTNAIVTLAVADWTLSSGKYYQWKTVSGVTMSNTVFVAPSSTSADDYAAASVLCVTQNTDALQFMADTTPSSDLTVNIVIFD